jgi:hypothetical protein
MTKAKVAGGWDLKLEQELKILMLMLVKFPML